MLHAFLSVSNLYILQHSLMQDIYIPPFFPVEKLSQSMGFGYVVSALAVH